MTLVLGWSRGTLLYYPPLVSLTLWRTARDLLKSDGHRPIETKVRVVGVICRELSLSYQADLKNCIDTVLQKYSADSSKHKTQSVELTYVHPGCHFGLWSFGTPDELWQEGINNPARWKDFVETTLLFKWVRLERKDAQQGFYRGHSHRLAAVTLEHADYILQNLFLTLVRVFSSRLCVHRYRSIPEDMSSVIKDIKPLQKTKTAGQTH